VPSVWRLSCRYQRPRHETSHLKEEEEKFGNFNIQPKINPVTKNRAILKRIREKRKLKTIIARKGRSLKHSKKGNCTQISRKIKEKRAKKYGKNFRFDLSLRERRREISPSLF
jgi:hypothetical protein